MSSIFYCFLNISFSFTNTQTIYQGILIDAEKLQVFALFFSGPPVRDVAAAWGKMVVEQLGSHQRWRLLRKRVSLQVQKIQNFLLVCNDERR
jgi:hypothetical protein